MVFIKRFSVQHRLGGGQFIKFAGDLIIGIVLLPMSRLKHVEVQPLVIMEPSGRVAPSLWVHGHQLAISHSRPYSRGHVADDLEILIICRISVAAQYPYNALVLIPVS